MSGRDGVAGIYYDGRSSRSHSVILRREGGILRIDGDGIALSYQLKMLQVSPPLGRTRRTISLPDGGSCEVEEPAAEHLLPATTGRWLHRWERHLGLAFTALALTVAVVWAFLQFGVPVLARQVAFAVPAQTESSMGEETLAMLDRLIFQPTRLPNERRDELQGLFENLRRNRPGAEEYRLELRSSPALGPNALALPAGIIVVTDEFVALSEHPDEITAVLAHEFAHAQQRHVLRQVLQNSAVGVIIASLTGDITSITSLAATLPTALIDARYSRSFEHEADAAAIAWLKEEGIPPERFVDILRRLQTAHDKRKSASGKDSAALGDLFSTHPETEERIRRALEAK